jgi:hypothetical protein
MKPLRNEFRRSINTGGSFRRIGAFRKSASAVECLREKVNVIRDELRRNIYRPQKFTQVKGDKLYNALPTGAFTERSMPIDTT